jgi:hypothetical protein
MATPKPPYEWTCQRCHGDNRPHTDLCGTCGMTANFTADQLTDFKTFDMRPVGMTLAEGIAGAACIALTAVLILVPLPSWLFWLDIRLILFIPFIVIVCMLALFKKLYALIAGVTSRK